MVREVTPPQILGCRDCLDNNPLGIPITMAFQPIIKAIDRSIFGYEALVRGTEGQGAGVILGQINDENRYTFDQTCRVKAIELASKLKLEYVLSINFLPNAVYNPRNCIQATLQASKEFDFPAKRLMFEVTEVEEVRDTGHLVSIFNEYKKQGFYTAIDDFGSGHAGLGLFVDFQPNIIKLDRHLISDIDRHTAKKHILTGTLASCRAMGIEVIAEGVETEAEYATLRELGVDLFQGYLFARPEIEALPEPVFPAI